jgi:hypothetical protein
MERMARGPGLLGIDTQKDFGYGDHTHQCNLTTYRSQT